MSRPGSIGKQPAFSSWWRHLRPYGKRQAAKMDRAHARLAVASRAAESSPRQVPKHSQAAPNPNQQTQGETHE